MARKKAKKNARYGNEDRVLRFAIVGVAALFLLGGAVIGVRLMNLRPDATEGMQILKKMDALDADEAEQEIDALEASEAELAEERSKRPNSEKFQDALILGDFIAQGLYEQDVLDESFVLAEAESCVRNPDETGVTENIEKILQAQPKVLFIELGVNDTIAEGSSASVFESDYQAVLEKLQAGLPDTAIYVNSILPVGEAALEADEGYSNIGAYNKILKALCRQAKVVFIDNTSLVQDAYYKNDGRHMTKDYFTLWADYLADAAKL